MSGSPAREGFRVLVADPIAREGIERLSQRAEVIVRTGRTPEQLQTDIGEFDALVVRSETRVTAAVLTAGRRLRVVARAGVGVDNIDVPAATQGGVIVVNSPEGNTVAAAEHTIAMLFALSRKIPDATASLRRGEWARREFVGVEIYNKVLGVVGFGKIGREVARRGRGLGMVVVAADSYVTPELARREGVELVELDELYRRADYVTVHTPLTRETRGLIGRPAFQAMKPGVRLLNCARGGIIDEAALLDALNTGQVAGAGLDVFETEPPPAESPLVRHPHVIATPHLGASTEEAQVNVALDVADQILAVLEGRPPRSAVNLPAVSAEAFARIAPHVELGTRIGRLLAQLADGAPHGVAVTYSGDLLGLDVQPVTRAVLMGLLQPVLAQSVNFVNAPYIAEQRGIRVTESKAAGEEDYPNFIRVELEESGRRRSIGGTVLGRRDLRIREVDQFQIDLKPEGTLLWIRHQDRPGVIGKVGTRLGEAGINIAGMYVGREAAGQR
ncbi:MAG: phosphoglycerate dehydrogenase, partial [Armatimonadetes bacterium]|nr:phosphoglycerate dehydrogenase [Armatimonadota bacterium]